jgi:peptidoglycan/xylan/chitin deacetylase (PgdA/CDA1 family)
MTTSWDDGDPLDLRIADLLGKYGLNGTFYLPRCAENNTMTSAQIRELGRTFEIGAHTLHHVVLTYATEQSAQQEITGSKSWIEDVTGRPCMMFCPPQGRYAKQHVRIVQKSGYLGLRSVELNSTDFPRPSSGLLVMPTTVQAHPHGLAALACNAIKRAAIANLWRFVTHGGSIDWTQLTRSMLRRVVASGGVFHLWGHSWELEESGQWQRLDDVLRFMCELSDQICALTNGQICKIHSAGGSSAGLMTVVGGASRDG